MDNIIGAFLDSLIPTFAAILMAVATIALDKLHKYLVAKTKIANTEAFDSAFSDLRGAVNHGINVAEEEAHRATKAQPDFILSSDRKLQRATEVIRGILTQNPELKEVLIQSGRSIVDLVHANLGGDRKYDKE